MSETIELKFTSKPRAIKNFLQFILFKRPGLKPGLELPKMKVSMNNLTIDPDHLRRYTDACGLKEKKTIPVLFPHVIASPFYMAMMSHRAFPFFVIGTLHLRNHIIQYRPIGSNEMFDIIVELRQKRVVKQGVEFDFTIELNSKGEVLWKSVSTMMKRGNFGTDITDSTLSDSMDAIPDTATYRELHVPKNMGKKFARITSDYNPIHLSRIAALVFGFKRDIIHAMWASAQAIGVLPKISEKLPLRVDLAFKGPVFMDSPTRVTLKKIRKGYRFDYYCEDNPRPSIQGKLISVSHKEKP
ncbi:MAG: MaoC/PaaZ C-terminal domain-containing protein [Spirochaetota bacterium]